MDEYLRLIFDEEYYLQQNVDVKEKGISPIAHFIRRGFKENRNPCSWVDTMYCKSLSKRIGEPIENINDFVNFIHTMSPRGLLGTSPFLCPLWLSLQLKFSVETIYDVVTARFDHVEKVSWHPSLMFLENKKGIDNFSSWVARISDEEIELNSLVDMTEYTKSHKDLKERFSTSPVQAFRHLWANGIFENRLKFMKSKGFRNYKQCDLIVIENLRAIYLFTISSNCTLFSHTIQKIDKCIKIENITEEKYTKIQDSFRSISSKQHHENPYGGIENFLDLNSFISDRKTTHYNINKICVHKKHREFMDLEFIARSNDIIKTKRVIYTINIGGYDGLPTFDGIELEDCSYVAITDKQIPYEEELPWIIIRPTFNEPDRKRICLWYKTHPSILFPNAEFVTWIDNNTICYQGFDKILGIHEQISELAAFRHPDRNCIYEEAEVIKNLDLDHSPIIDRIVANMRAKGMPPGYGLFETGVTFSRNQEPCVRDFFNTWWKNIFLGSRRDQMSFTYAAWLESVQISPLDLNFNTKNSKFFRRRLHKNPMGRAVC